MVAKNIYTNEEHVFNAPKRLASNSSMHNFSILYSNEAIVSIIDTANPQQQAGIVHVLPEYEFSNIPFYIFRHVQSSDKKIQLFYEFIQECVIQHQNKTTRCLIAT